jgi:hypothetical protein
VSGPTLFPGRKTLLRRVLIACEDTLLDANRKPNSLKEARLKVNLAAVFGFVTVLACGASAASADVIKLSCTSAAGTLTADVSSYDIGIAQSSSIGSQGSGSGAGKVTFNPADIHIPLADFSTFLPFVEDGRPFTTCTLSHTTNGNRTTEYEFKPAAVSSIDAIGVSRADRDDASYADLKLVFGQLLVETSRSKPVRFPRN